MLRPSPSSASVHRVASTDGGLIEPKAAETATLSRTAHWNRIYGLARIGAFGVVAWLALDRILDSFDSAVGENTAIDVNVTVSLMLTAALTLALAQEGKRRSDKKSLKRVRSEVEEVKRENAKLRARLRRAGMTEEESE